MTEDSHILKRAKESMHNRTYVNKDFRTGNLLIKNVPYMQFEEDIGADGYTEFLSGRVAYTVAKIAQHMSTHGLTEVNYEDFANE